MYDELVKALRGFEDYDCLDFFEDRTYAQDIAREAADAIEELLAWHNADTREIEKQKYLIANAVGVVTCGECKFRHNRMRQGCQGRSADWFCADGERRELR